MAHAGWLRALARSLVADPATADDLVQDTWVAAIRHPPDAGRPLRPWLARVVHNLAKNRRRGDAHRSERESVERPGAGAISPADIAAEVEAQRTLAEAVLALEEPLRTTVVLRYFRGLNASEIARAQHVPSGTVRWRLKRAIELLRVDLDRRFGGRRESWCVALAALVPRESGALSASSVSTGVVIMSTSAKVGIAAALAVCIGVVTWTLADDARQDAIHTDSFGNVADPVSEIDAVDPVAESPSRELAARAPSPPEAPTHASRVAAALAPLQPQDCCIVGRVLDSNGAPIAGAAVVAMPTDVEEPGLLARQWAKLNPVVVTTDKDGVFAVEAAAATPCAVIAELQGLASRAESPHFAGEVVAITLTRGARLRVSVLSSTTSSLGTTRSPINGAFIHAWATAEGQPRSYWSGTATSGIDGIGVIDGIPAGAIRVRANFRGLVPSEVKVESSGDGELSCEIVLAVPGALEGTVIDRTTRLPIADASIESNEIGVATDPSGKYRLEVFAPGKLTYSVAASAAGYATEYSYVTFPESGATNRFDFELARAQHVRGRVVDASGGPVYGATVAYRGSIATDPFVGETHRAVVETREDGSFEIDDLHANTSYRATVAAEGHGARALSIGPLADGTSTTELGDIVLAPPSSIFGRIEGAAPSGGWHVVRLHGDESVAVDASRLSSTRPDPQGRFVFDSLGAGRYRIELVERRVVESKRTERVVATLGVELGAGESKEDVVLRVASAELRGRVVGPDGASISDCRIAVFDAKSAADSIATTLAEDDGSFRVAVDAEGPLRITIDDSRLFFESRTIDGVRAGGDELVVVLEPFRSEFAVRGRLFDASGKPPERVYVAFTDATTKQRLGRVAMPDESGRFEMKNLRDVAYDLELVDFGNLYKPARVANVRPSGADVVLEIERRE